MKLNPFDPPFIVPAELAKRKNWIGWRAVQHPGEAKPRKVPVCIRTGFGKGYLEPRNHVSYDEAVDAIERLQLSGVGFVLTPGCGLVGGDMDKCRNPATGELDGWAQAIVEWGETYFEVSPSGEGVRFWALADATLLRAIKSSAAGVELYPSGRYLTFTGDKIEGASYDIKRAPKAVHALMHRARSFKGEDAGLELPDQADDPTTPEAFARHMYRQSLWGRINAAALERILEWAPEIFPTGTPVKATGGWRVKSADLDRPDLQEDLSIDPRGIKDFGVHDMKDIQPGRGDRTGKRSAIDLVCEWGAVVGVGNAKEAAQWLAEKLNIPFGVELTAVSDAELDCFDAGDEDEKIPPREWLLGTTFCREFVSGLVSAGGGAKTTVRLAQLLSLACGRTLTGEHAFVRARVMIVCLEDDMKELRRRIWAARKHHGVSAAEVKGYLILTTPRKLKIAELDQRGKVAPGGLLAAIGKAIDKYSLDLVCIDPAVKAHGLEENDNKQIDAFASMLADLAVERNIAVDLLAHERKGGVNGPAAGDADRSRGASSLRDAQRLAKTLTRMTQAEAAALGVSEEDRAFLVRLDNAKVNTAPPMTKAMWFKLVDVALGNGNETYPNGDHVQTVERWTPPDAFEGLDPDELNAVLRKLDEGMDSGQRYSTSSAATKRAAWKAIQEQFPDVEEGPCKAIIKRWKANGMFVEEEYYDKIEEHTRRGIKSAQLIGGCK